MCQWRILRYGVDRNADVHSVEDQLSAEEYRLFQLQVVHRPDAGAMIPGSGGLRKVRWRLPGRGKRGGARVVYYWRVATERLYLLFLYPKNERSDLSPTQLRVLRNLVTEE